MPVDDHFLDCIDLLRMDFEEIAQDVAEHDEDQAFEIVALYCEFSARMAAELRARIGADEYDRRITEYCKRRDGAGATN